MSACTCTPGRSLTHRYTREIQDLNTILCKGIVKYWDQIGVFRFLLTAHVKINTKQTRPQSSHTMQYFTHVYLYTQTAGDADDIPA